MEVEAVSAAFSWLEKSNFTHVLFITDLLSMLQKAEEGMFQIERLESLNKSQVMGITWVFCLGHAGLHGNEQVDKFIWLVPVAGQLLFYRNDVIGAVWDKMYSESDEQKMHM